MRERPLESARRAELGWARGVLMIVFATNLLQFGSIELATGSVGRVLVDSLGRGVRCASETPDDGPGLLVSLEQHYVRAFERASAAVATPDTLTVPAGPRAVTSRSLKAAEALGVSRKTLSSILNRRAGISPEMAVRLSIAFDTSAESWLAQQSQYDLWLAEKRRKDLEVRRLVA